MFFLACAHVNALCGCVCAMIFIKKILIVHYYLMSLSFKFHEDLCINACAGGVNKRTRDKNARARLCGYLCTYPHEIFQMVKYYLMSLSFKFHNDQSFCRGDIPLFVTMYNFENYGQNQNNYIYFWGTFRSFFDEIID